MPALVAITITTTTMATTIPEIGAARPAAAAPLPRQAGRPAFVPPRPAMLRLMAWLSPAFPTGAFAYSHGLEWAVEASDIRDETTLHAWLQDVVTHGSGRTDTIILRHAHCSASNRGALDAIAELAVASVASRERRAEALNQGRAFVLAAQPWGVPDLPEDVPYAVAVGATAGLHGVPEDDTAAAYLLAFTANLISAAVRLVPLGQSAGLRVLAGLETLIVRTADDTKTAALEDIGGCCFRSDLAAMRHETQYTRLFRS
ncbi:MAG TPA: urease accessory protein UreF [Rhodopila sp.]|nr:urease accessory protein UreF [Rhodopila sp.]